MPTPPPIAAQETTDEPESFFVESPIPLPARARASRSPGDYSIEQGLWEGERLSASISRIPIQAPSRGGLQPRAPAEDAIFEPSESPPHTPSHGDPSPIKILPPLPPSQPESEFDQAEAQIYTSGPLVDSPSHLQTAPNEYTDTGPASPTRQPIPSRGRARIPDYSFPREGSRSPASSYRSRRHHPLTPTNQDVSHWNTPAQGPEPLYHPITAGVPPLTDVYVHPRPRLRSSAGRLNGVRQEQRERSRSPPVIPMYPPGFMQFNDGVPIIPSRHDTPVSSAAAQMRAENRYAATQADTEDYRSPPDSTPDPTVAWSKCNKRLKEHDYHTIKAWKEDIDTLLVLAGLISAVLTAFIIESYKLLQQDPQDTTNLLLRQILNETAREDLTPTVPFTKTSLAIRLNTLWFASLVFSLSSASLGLLVKQWLQSYMSNAASSPRENARVRQFRHQGLTRWRVPEVIALLPILVQIALASFFVGLLDLLWHLDHVVAGIVSVIVIASLSFVVITTITPSFSRHCPHKSPQSLAIYRLTQLIMRTVMKLVLHFTSMVKPPEPPTLYVDPRMFRSQIRRRRASFLEHVMNRHHHSWREREKETIERMDTQLDRHLLAHADATLMDDEFLVEVVQICLNDTDLPSALNGVIDILKNRAPSVIAGRHWWKPCRSAERGICTLIAMVTDVLSRLQTAPLKMEDIVSTLEFLEQLCHAFPFKNTHEDVVVRVYQRIFLVLAPYLLYKHKITGNDIVDPAKNQDTTNPAADPEQGPGLPEKSVHDAEQKIRSLTFNILYVVILQNFSVEDPPPVGPAVILNVINFVAEVRKSSSTRAYYGACRLALCLFNATEIFGRTVLSSITAPLQKMLETLEADLGDSETKIGHEYHAPSPSLLTEICNLLDEPRGVKVRPELIEIMDRLVKGARYAHTKDDQQTQEQRDYASKVAREQLQKLYNPRRNVGRKKALWPAENLADMHLQLPPEPPNPDPLKLSPQQ